MDTHGYRGGKIFKTRHLAHRIIWAIQKGVHPTGPLDHINGDRMDNRMCNLRAATVAENSRNGAIRASNTSGRKGVTWNRHTKRWQAQIGYAYGKRHLGYFSSLEAAAEAYDRAALELHGDFAKTNAIVMSDAKSSIYGS